MVAQIFSCAKHFIKFHLIEFRLNCHSQNFVYCTTSPCMCALARHQLNTARIFYPLAWGTGMYFIRRLHAGTVCEWRHRLNWIIYDYNNNFRTSLTPLNLDTICRFVLYFWPTMWKLIARSNCKLNDRVENIFHVEYVILVNFWKYDNKVCSSVVNCSVTN